MARFKLPPEQAEDLIQEVLLRSFTHPPAEETAEGWRSWLLVVARRAMIDLHRYHQRHPMQSLDARMHELRDHRAEEAIRRENRTRKLEWLRARLAEMAESPSLEERLLYGQCVEGRSVKELAEREGLEPHAVSIRLHRARLRLRALAAKELPSSDSAE